METRVLGPADARADGQQNVEVCCRVRPERSDTPTVDLRCEGREVHLRKVDGVCEQQTFKFDKVFPSDTPQAEVYDQSARPVIEAILEGINGTVLAYGPTASGKTYTMEGALDQPERQGIIPRMVWTIFDGIHTAPQHVEFTVKVSIVEIYNDKVRDLLVPCARRPSSHGGQNLKVHEDPLRGIYVGDCTEIYVAQEQDVFAAMRVGHSHRSVAVTNVNEHSSRSHLIFILTVEQKDTLAQTIKVGKLHLVDLAGAESAARSGVLGERLDEAKNINKSLCALGNVIHALTDKRPASSERHVPYRDSKLTRVLQESLGGNAKTSLIVTVSPILYSVASTITSLRFGCRAKSIRNHANVNEVLSAEQLQLLLKRRDDRYVKYRGRCVELEKVLRRAGVPVPPWPERPEEREGAGGSCTPEMPSGQTVPGGQRSPGVLKWAAVQRGNGASPECSAPASEASEKPSLRLEQRPRRQVRSSVSTDTLSEQETLTADPEDERARALEAENARLRMEVRALQEAGAVAVTAAVEAAESLESLQTSRSKGPSKPLVFEPAVRAVPRAAPTSARPPVTADGLGQQLEVLKAELERHAPEECTWRQTVAEMEAKLQMGPAPAPVLSAWPARVPVSSGCTRRRDSARKKELSGKVRDMDKSVSGLEEMFEKVCEVNQQLRTKLDRRDEQLLQLHERLEQLEVSDAPRGSSRFKNVRERARIRVPIRGGGGG